MRLLRQTEVFAVSFRGGELGSSDRERGEGTDSVLKKSMARCVRSEKASFLRKKKPNSSMTLHVWPQP